MRDQCWTRPGGHAVTTVSDIADHISGALLWTLWLD
jgi:hypothetical protein